MIDIDEFNRLTVRGLNAITAIAVAEGKMDEMFEVDRAIERRKVHAWCKGKKDIPSSLTPVWDCKPEHFYLALDGDMPTDHNPEHFKIIWANIADILRILTFNSSRDKDPWDRRYKRKSCGIAYRWFHNDGITPPLISEYKGQIHILGGMHRFHLADHYGAARMPFLVRKADLAAVAKLIPSATEAANSSSC